MYSIFMIKSTLIEVKFKDISLNWRTSILKGSSASHIPNAIGNPNSGIEAK